MLAISSSCVSLQFLGVLCLYFKRQLVPFICLLKLWEHSPLSSSPSPSPSPSSSSDVEVSDSGVWARRSPKPNWYTGFIEQSWAPYWEKPNNRIPLLWLSAWTHLSRRLIFLIFLFGTKNYMHMSQFKKLYNGSIQGLIIDQKYWERKHNTFFLELLYQHCLFIKEHLLCAQINDQG